MPMTMTFSIGDLVSIAMLLIAVFHFAIRNGKTELKVDTMWGFLIRRMKMEALQDGAGTYNSPFEITEDSLKPFQHLRGKLSAIYCKSKNKTSEIGLMSEIESSLHADLEDICVAHKFHPGRCLLACVELAKRPYVNPSDTKGSA